MKYMSLVWANLWRSRMRTILTLLSAIVAFLLFGILNGVDAYLKQAVDRAHLDILVTNSSGGLISASYGIVLNGGGTIVNANGGSITGGSAIYATGSSVYVANQGGIAGTGTNHFNGGNDVALLAVPEPNTWAMLLGGFGMLAGIQRMRRRNM